MSEVQGVQVKVIIRSTEALENPVYKTTMHTNVCITRRLPEPKLRIEGNLL